MEPYSLEWWLLFIFSIIFNAYGQIQREMTLSDMEVVQSRLQDIDFGENFARDDFNLSSMHMVSGKTTTVKNMVKYSTSMLTTAQHCTVVVVIDRSNGKQISTTRDCQNSRARKDQLSELLQKLIRSCNQIRAQDGNEQDYRVIISVLERALDAYRKTGNIMIFDRVQFRYNVFSNYNAIMRQLLEEMRRQYVAENKISYVSNIEFMLQIQQIVNAYQQQKILKQYAKIQGVIVKIMECYYNNQPMDVFADELREFLRVSKLRVVVVPLIRLIYQPPPLPGRPTVEQPTEGDAFVSALQRLISELQAVNGQSELGGTALQLSLLAHFQDVLRTYLAQLYQLPKYNKLPDFNYDIANVEIVGYIHRYLIILKDQYNKQHDTQQTEMFFKMIKILEVLMKCQGRLPKETMSKLITVIFSMTLFGMKVSPDPTRCDALIRIMEILYQLALVPGKEPPVRDGKDKLIEIILQILEQLRRGNPDNIQITVPDMKGFEDIIKMLRLIFPGTTPEEPEDDFIIQIKLIIERIEILRQQQNNTSEYEILMKIVKMINRNYVKDKMLRMYLVDELQFQDFGGSYGEILIRILELMEHKYIQQGEFSESEKLARVIKILKIMIQITVQQPNNEVLQMKEILLRLIKEIWMKNRLEENYIALILRLRENNKALLGLIVKLMVIINQMPRVEPPSTVEDSFVKAIKLLIVLLQNMHDEGKSDEGYCHTMYIVQTILEIYLKEKRLPEFNFGDLKVHLMFEEYNGIINELILRVQKKYIDQHNSNQFSKWNYILKMREFLFRLKIQGNAKGELVGYMKIEVILLNILEDLTNKGVLTKDYILILEKLINDHHEIYKTIILDIFKFLETCPGEPQGINKAKGPADLVIVMIKLIRDRSQQDKNRKIPVIIEMLERIIAIIKGNGNRLPQFSALKIEFELILRSGFCDRIMINFLRDLMGIYSKENQVKEIGIIVKINYLLDYILQLKRIQIRVNDDVGFGMIFEDLIALINDINRNGQFTKNHLVFWKLYSEQFPEFKTVILYVIGLLSQSCEPCKMPIEKPDGSCRGSEECDSSSGVVIPQSGFEGLIKEVRGELIRIYKDINEEVGYIIIDRWIDQILHSFIMNDYKLPKIDRLNLQLYKIIKNYDVIINMLIAKLINQYQVQMDSSEAKVLRYVIEIRKYIQKGDRIRNARDVGSIRAVLEHILRAILRREKLERDLFDQLAKYQEIPEFTVFIVEITGYLKTLPGDLWSVPVLRDDFEAQLRALLIQLKYSFQINGAPEALYKEQVAFIENLIQIYVENEEQLPLNLPLHLVNMYQVVMHFPVIWRQVIGQIIAQYQLQNQVGDIGRFQFLLQMQTFFRQLLQVRDRLEWTAYKKLILLMNSLFLDSGRGRLRQDYINFLLVYCRYQPLTAIVPNMVYYLTNWTNDFIWIQGTPAQLQNMAYVRKMFSKVKVSEYIVLDVVTVWNGNLACNCVE